MPVFYDTEIDSPLMLGTAQYPSPAIMAEAFRASRAGIATVSCAAKAGRAGFSQPDQGP
jgi:thiazole synthase